MNRQKGQALVESVVAMAFVTVPLTLLLPLLSKTADIQHRTQQASRYTAWERTVWLQRRPSDMPGGRGYFYASRSEQDIARQLPWRIFQQAGQPLSTSQPERWSWQDKLYPSLKHLVKQGSSLTPLLAANSDDTEDNDELGRFSRAQSRGGLPGSLGGLTEKAVDLLSLTKFKLDTREYYRTQVNTRMEPLYLNPFTGKEAEGYPVVNLTFSGQNALLAQGWNAGGPKHLQNRVKRLVPTTWLDTGFIRTAQNTLGLLPVAKELRTSSLKLGHVDVEALPSHHLCTYGTANCGG
ncbi:hypothetical protein [Gallaecimonas sp. GXIMD4217]|uniref:hypothetical protein n=1 Tax=Gallaecimonas sp. GXIMD4217 TaxID=3131927 RepID=UPI00311B2AC9